jgi:hypothetical protein
MQIQSGIQVPICHKATRADVYPLAEWQIAIDRPTLGAHLAGWKPTIGSEHLHARCRCFVGDHLPKHPKAHITDGPREPVIPPGQSHQVCAKIFNR